MTDDASQDPSSRRARGDSSGLWAGTALLATRNYLFQFDGRGLKELKDAEAEYRLHR